MGKALSLEVIMGMQDRASGPLKHIDRASHGASKELKATQSQLNKLNKQQKDITGYRELQKATKQNSEAFKKALEHSKQLKREYKATSQPTKKLARDMERASTNVERLSELQKKHTRELERTKSRLQDARINTRDLGEAQKKLTRDIEASDRALEGHQQQLSRTSIKQEKLNAARRKMQGTQQLAGNLASSGAGAAAVGTTTMLATAKTASIGMDFDASMSRVQALTRLKKDSKEFAELRKQSRTLGATTKFSAGEAAGGQSFLAMAGFSPKAIQAAMPGILNTAAAAGQDIATTADIGSNILSGFNLDASQMSRVGDVLTATFTRGNVDLISLGETMKYVAPVAVDLGVSIEEAAAMTAKLGDNGIKGSMAGTGLKSIFSRLAAGPKMAKKALAQLGVSAVNDAGKMRPMVEILKDLGDATANMDEDKRLEALKGIAGLEAVASLSVLVKEAQSGKLQKAVKAIGDDKDASLKVAKVMSDNASGDLRELLSSIQDVSIELTSLNGGGLRDLIKSATGITRAIGDWIRENPELAASITKVVVVGGAMVLGFGALALATSALLGPFGMLRFVLSSLGVRGFGVTKIFKGIGKEGGWLRDKVLPTLKTKIWDTSRAFVSSKFSKGKNLLRDYGRKAWQLTTTTLPALSKKVLSTGQAFVTAKFSAGKQALQNIASKATHLTKTAFSGLIARSLATGKALKLASAAAGRKVLSGLATSAMYLGKTVLPIVGRAIAILGRALLLNPIGIAVTAIAGGAYLIYKNWDGISNWFSAKWAATKVIFGEFKTYLSTWWASVGGTFSGALADIGAKLINWSPLGILYSVIADALNQLGADLPKKFSELGGMIIDGLTQGIKNKAASLKASIVGVGDNVSGWFKDKLNINSPSKVFVKHGNSVVKGLEKGLGENQKVLAPITDISKRLKQAGAGLTLAASLPLAADQLNAPLIDTRAPLTPAISTQSQVPSLIIENLVINAAPGMDEQALAQLVTREIERHQRQTISAQRANLNDRD